MKTVDLGENVMLHNPPIGDGINVKGYTCAIVKPDTRYIGNTHIIITNEITEIPFDNIIFDNDGDITFSYPQK